MRSFSVGGANGSVWMKDLYSSTIQDLKEFDYELFLNMTLLRTFCTSTITSDERFFSTVRRLKTHLRATLTSERESALAQMHIH